PRIRRNLRAPEKYEAMSMTPSAGSAKAEWAKYWSLPLVAALGYSVSSLHLYGLGPFMEPLQQEFGWSRAQVLSGSVIVSLLVSAAGVSCGFFIDRLGPRRIALLGLILIGASVASCGTATGSMTNWLLLWSLLAISLIFGQAPVWTAAVVSRFDA